MGAYQYMFADRNEYEHYRSLPEARASVSFESNPIAGSESRFTVSVRDEHGEVPPLFVDMEKLIHVVIVSKDQTVFAHVHPDDDGPLSEEEIRTATFDISYVFPKAGEYLISIDYANGVRLESSQHTVYVAGAPEQNTETALYPARASVEDFDVSIEYPLPFAGEVSTLVYKVTKNGSPAELEPYLSAAMHIAVVKNDFQVFAHTHGEVHPPGAQLPPVIVRDGKIVHSMASMNTPARFSDPVDAHVVFPEPGLYTVWAQFQSEGEVYAVPTTVRVE
jgi:P-type Cu+ transporter